MSREMQLRETVLQQVGLEVDEAKRRIKGLKVIGLLSANGREYLQKAIDDALPMYEGAMVNLNHLVVGEDVRPVQDRIGKLVKARSDKQAGGARADLLYNPAHPYAPSLVWWAKNAPECIGLSHDAFGKAVERNGVTVVEKILKVNSVDFVADAATTRGLHEGRGGSGLTVLRREEIVRLLRECRMTPQEFLAEARKAR